MRKLAVLMALGLAGCAPAPEVVEAPAFLCGGNEPFWLLEVDDSELVLTHAGIGDEPDVTRYTGTWMELDEERGNFFWQGETAEGAAFDVTIKRAECQGTGDASYAYQSSYGTGRPNGIFEPGCCKRR